MLHQQKAVKKTNDSKINMETLQDISFLKKGSANVYEEGNAFFMFV